MPGNGLRRIRNFVRKLDIACHPLNRIELRNLFNAHFIPQTALSNVRWDIES